MPDTLDAQAIEARLAVGPEPASASVVASCDSTNTTLLASTARGPAVLVADFQSQGRGRRGRRWRAAPGSALMLSVRRLSTRPLRDLPGLSLAIGVAARRALAALGVPGVALKWPNDLLAGDRKLGGILVETRLSGGAVAVVAGIGVNWHDAPDGGLRRPATCVSRLVPQAPSRTQGAVAIAREVLDALAAFDAGGLEPFRAEWETSHAYAGRRLKVRLGDGRTVTGIAEGLGADGSLRLATRRGMREVLSGTIVSAAA